MESKPPWKILLKTIRNRLSKIMILKEIKSYSSPLLNLSYRIFLLLSYNNHVSFCPIVSIKLPSISLCLSVSLSLSLPFSRYVFLFLCLSLSLALSFSVQVCLYVLLSPHPPFSFLIFITASPLMHYAAYPLSVSNSTLTNIVTAFPFITVAL